MTKHTDNHALIPVGNSSLEIPLPSPSSIQQVIWDRQGLRKPVAMVDYPIQINPLWFLVPLVLALASFNFFAHFIRGSHTDSFDSLAATLNLGDLIGGLLCAAIALLLLHFFFDHHAAYERCRRRFVELLEAAKRDSMFLSRKHLQAFGTHHFNDVLRQEAELEGRSDKLWEDIDQTTLCFCAAHAADGGQQIIDFLSEARYLVAVARSVRAHVTPEMERALAAACDMAEVREKVLGETRIKIARQEIIDSYGYEEDSEN